MPSLLVRETNVVTYSMVIIMQPTILYLWWEIVVVLLQLVFFFFSFSNDQMQGSKERTNKRRRRRGISNNSDGWKKQSRPFYPITPFCSCTSRSRPPPHTLCWLSSSSFYYDVYYDSKEGKERERVFVCKVLLPHNPFVFCFRASFYIHFQLSSFYYLSLFLPMSI